jgi:hypothetical protein
LAKYNLAGFNKCPDGLDFVEWYLRDADSSGTEKRLDMFFSPDTSGTTENALSVALVANGWTKWSGNINIPISKLAADGKTSLAVIQGGNYKTYLYVDLPKIY